MGLWAAQLLTAAFLAILFLQSGLESDEARAGHDAGAGERGQDATRWGVPFERIQSTVPTSSTKCHIAITTRPWQATGGRHSTAAA